MRNITILLSIVTAFMLASCYSHDHNGHDHEHEETEHADGHADEHGAGHDGEIILTKAQAETAGLTLETVAPGAFQTAIKVSGLLQAGQGDEQTVVATAAGVVSFANASIAEGTPVSRGQAIATVSARNLQDGDPQQKARAEYDAARKTYERAKSLVGEKIISQREYEAAQRDYETAKAAYSGTAASATASGAVVSSLISGFVKSRLASQGEYVVVGQPIAVVTQNRRMQLRADVPVSHLPMLRSVTAANFRMAGADAVHSTAALHGRLLSYGRSVTEGTAYVPVTFEFDNIGDIVSGAYADVWLLSSSRSGVVSVPLSAVMESMGEKYVFIQTEPDAYRKCPVQTGGSDGRRIEILSGLKLGDKVVVKGAYEVKLASASSAIPPHNHNH